jgi:hypothetical protein|tara:strand:+ start:148 stop:594 length:447 start_codon:yes stop_codon:yes gene_type:complete
MIRSFRGQLDDGEQEKISLHTNTGKQGYRIVKFSLMCVQPGAGNQESVVQIFKDQQSTVPTSAATIDFSQNRLLAAGIFTASTNQKTDPEDLAIIFDNEIFNQDIFITHTDNEGTLAINYYIELEFMNLALDQATVATLKDIRNTGTQ